MGSIKGENAAVAGAIAGYDAIVKFPGNSPGAMQVSFDDGKSFDAVFPSGKCVEIILPENEFIWEKTWAQLGSFPSIIQLLNPEGLICTEDPTVLIYWTQTGIKVDFGSSQASNGWKLLIG